MNKKNLILMLGCLGVASCALHAQVSGDISVDNIFVEYQVMFPRGDYATYLTNEGLSSELPLNISIYEQEYEQDGMFKMTVGGGSFQIWNEGQAPDPDRIWFKIAKVGSALVPSGDAVTSVSSPSKLVMTNSSGKIDGGLLDLSGALFVTPQFQIGVGNQFSLFQSGTSTPGVVLNPAGGSILPGNVTLGAGTLNVVGGNVGVGVGEPTAKLQVAGNLRVGSSLSNNEIRFYGTSEDGDGAFTDTVIAERLYAGSDRSELLIFKGNDLDSSLSPTIAWGDRIRFDTPGAIVFQTGGGYRSYAPTVEGNTVMTINSAGRILVGTTVDDGGNKLQVSGNVKVNGKVRVPPSGDLSMGSFTSGENPAL